MAKHFQGRTDENGVPLTQWPAIQLEAAKFPHFVISVLNEEEAITDRQRRWYKGVCLKGLSDWNGDTVDEWDYRLKIECGSEIFKVPKYTYGDMVYWRPESIANKGKKQITEFIENILSKSITEGWPVYPPDPDLRRI
jgi:hypothetical protein